MTRRQVFLRNAFLARVPIFWLLVLAALGPIAVFFPHSPLGGIFDVDTYWGLLFSAATALLVAFSAILALNLIIEHGPERFDTNAMPPPAIEFSPSLAILFLGATPALVVTICSAWMSTAYSVFGRVVLSAGGVATAVAVLVIAQLLQFLIADPNEKRPNYLVVPFDRVPVLGHLLDLAHQHSGGFLSRSARSISDVIERLLLPRFQNLLPGYLRERNGVLHFTPGHQFAAVLGLTATTIWFSIGWIKQSFINGAAPAVPTLAYVLVALLVLGMIFSGLAFFLDRWRIPLLFSLLAWSFVQGSCHWTDHFYDITDRADGALPPPALVLTSKAPVPIIVVASGGGIHAGAWSARVLEGLEEACGAAKPTPCHVLDRVALFSSISGGSMATLYLGSSFYGDEGQAGTLSTLAQIAELSRASSLDDVAWGLVYPDLLHVFWPFKLDRLVDRGWALERTWAVRSHTDNVYLSDWAAKTQRTNGRFPAFIFNATVVEQGRPLAMSTTAFTQNARAQTRKLVSLQDLYGRRADVHVPTAARLSATFSFVAPAARSTYASNDQPKAALHIVDGGYYDNFGVLSALDWLDEALGPAGAAANIEKIAMIEIRLGTDNNDESGREHGWPYQFYAPLSAVVSVRNHEQLREDHARENLYADVLGKRMLTSFNFVYADAARGDCQKMPLSWKLRKSEKDCIDDTWMQVNDVNSPLGKSFEGLRKLLEDGAKSAR